MSDRKKVAIVGTAEPHWREAPYADESWDIWSLGGNFANIPRYTRWFELHELEDVCKGWGGTPEQEAAQRNVYVSWLAEQGDRLMVQRVRDEVPHATEYPLHAVLERFPNAYFSNSVSWMLALAIMEGYTDIGIYGVDMALSSEYGTQRPSVEFFIGIAMGLGIQIYMPESTSLLKTRRLYAFDSRPDGFMAVVRAKKQELTERAKHAKRHRLEVRHALHEAEKHEHAMNTALEIMGYMEENFER